MNRGVRVRYVGCGYVEQYDDSENGINEFAIRATKNKEHRGYFVTGTDFIEDLHFFGAATISSLGFIHEELPRGIIPRFAENSVFIITDKDGNPAPFTIEKGVDRYRHKNGNALRLIFDDAPPTDIEPTEKPLSESEKRASLNVTYGLLELLKKGGKSQNEIISELEKFDYFGMSESNLKKLFANANNIKKREH